MSAVVELCDVDFGKVHEVEAGRFEGTVRRNAPGNWWVEFPLDQIAPDVLASVEAVRVRDGKRVLFAGYRSVVDGGGGGTTRRINPDEGRRVLLEGVDCWYWLTSRLAFPDPATDEPWSTATDTRTGTGSAVIKAYIEANCGVSALTARQVPGLTVSAPTAGVTGSWSARLQPLSDLVARVATDAGLVVEPTLTQALVPIVNVRAAADRTASLIVSDLTDLVEAEQRDVPPSATWVLAAGSGTGASRTFRSADSGVAGVRRIESLTEQSNASTSNELFQLAEANRREAGYGLFVSGRVMESAADKFEYNVDYQLGDLVTVQVQGVRYPAPVAAVQFSVSSVGLVTTPTLGTYSPDRLRGMRRDLLGLAERFNNNIA